MYREHECSVFSTDFNQVSKQNALRLCVKRGCNWPPEVCDSCAGSWECGRAMRD